MRRKAKFGSKEEVERRFRSRPPFAKFHADAWKEYLDNNFKESAGMYHAGVLLSVCSLKLADTRIWKWPDKQPLRQG